MRNVQIIVAHPRLPDEVIMTVRRDFRTRTGVVPKERTAFVCEFKRVYKTAHGRDVGWIEFRDLVITETALSPEQPQGCALDDCCVGCDQGFHCHRTDRGCYQ